MPKYRKLLSALPLLLATLLLAQAAPAASASSVYLSDVSLKKGEQVQVAVNFDTDLTDVYTLSADIQLPVGLEFVRMSNNQFVTLNTDRAAGSMATLNNKTGRLAVVNMLKNPFTAGEGAIAWVLLTATDELAATAEITLTNVVVKRTNGENVDATAPAATVTRLEGEVDPNPNPNPDPDPEEGTATLTFSADTVLVEPEGEATIDVLMTNTAQLSGLQARLVLPAALTATVQKGDRLPSLQYNAETGMLIVTPTGSISGQEGKLFTISLKAAATVAEKQTVTLTDIVLTTAKLNKLKPQDISTTVVKKDPTQKNELLQGIDQLLDLMERVDAELNQYADSVQQVCRPDLYMAKDMISAEREKILEDYANNTLDYEQHKAQLADIEDFLLRLQARAAEAQKEYEQRMEEQRQREEEQRQKEEANDAAYDRLTKDLDTVEAKLSEAVIVITEQCPDVADDYKNDLAALKAMIDELRKTLEDLHIAVTLTTESTIDTATIEQAITALVEAARQAQAAYEAEQAKRAANEAANTRLIAQLDELQAKLDAATERINTECPDVASQYTAQLAAVQADIDSLRLVVKTAYEAVELTAESTLSTKKQEETISMLVADALYMQEEYEKQVAEEQRRAVNDSVYAVLTDQLAAVEALLQQVESEMEGDCREVADLFADRLAELQTQVQTLRETLEAAHEGIELTAESKLDTEELTAAILTLQADLEGAQRALDELKELNERVYAEWTDAFDAVAAEIAETKDILERECPLVAADYADRLEELIAALADMRTKLQADYEALELSDDTDFDVERLRTKLAELLSDARAAQEEKAAIGSIRMEQLQGAVVYDLQGRRQQRVQRGQVVIVRQPNGTVRRMVVK